MKVILKTFLILLVILVAVLAFLGFSTKINHIWDNAMPEYTYGMDLKGILELRYTADMSEEEKNVYIDENDNILGIVKEDTTNTTNLEGISLENDGENEAEKNTTTTEEKEEVNYAKASKKIKANPDGVLTPENFEASKKIIQKRIETLKQYEYNIRLDDLTGEIIIEIPEDDNSVKIEQFIISARKI